eukprot:1159331-Pelagomonas_calceolata.AAC.9
MTNILDIQQKERRRPQITEFGAVGSQGLRSGGKKVGFTLRPMWHTSRNPGQLSSRANILHFDQACPRLHTENFSQTVKLVSLWLVHASQQQIQKLRHEISFEDEAGLWHLAGAVPLTCQITAELGMSHAKSWTKNLHLI